MLSLISMILCLVSTYNLGERVEISGKGRMRFRLVAPDIAAESIQGISGEYLRRGFDARTRLELGIAYRLANPLRLGAAVRLSNEEADATAYPPDLVSTRAVAGWWWAEFRKGIVEATVGTYDASFTPLTLMRWDLSDNPLGSGSACCAVAMGGLRGSSLEEFVADYKLEGARLVLRPGSLQGTAVFARTALPLETRTYAQYLGGLRAHYDLFCPWAMTRARFGVTGLRVSDDRNSVTMAQHPPLRSDVLGADLELPILGQFALLGEWAYSLRDDNTRIPDPESRGSGINAGFRFGDRENLDAQLQYVRSDPDFFPLMRALSCPRDRHGIRASGVLRNRMLGAVNTSFSVYAKFQQEVRPMLGSVFTAGQYPGRYWIAAATSRLEPWYGYSFGIDGEWRHNTRRDDPATAAYDETIGATEVIASLIAGYRFTLQNTIQLKYALVRHDEQTNAYHGQLAYWAHLPSLELNLKF